MFFLIRSLERGGAERQLVELARGLASDGYEVTVCTFYEGGALRPELEGVRGLRLISLGKRTRWDIGEFVLRLFGAVREAQPDIIHGYMPVANELALVMARACNAKAVLGIRSSNMDFSRYDGLAKLMFRVGARLSRFSDAIIVNSEAGRRHHVGCGYAAGRMFVVPNGIDHAAFRPDPVSRERLRAEWGFAASQRVVGLAARFDPKKDHETFLRAAALVKKARPMARFVCAGGSTPRRRADLVAIADSLELGDCLRWVGLRQDMCAVYNAFDVAVLSSAFGEGFPNTIAEAMAAGRPCVVTAVGDSELVVGDRGIVVPPRDPPALAAGIMKLIDLSNDELARMGELARERVVSLFHRERLVSSTKAVFAQVLKS